jgi:hypothetical protein
MDHCSSQGTPDLSSPFRKINGWLDSGYMGGLPDVGQIKLVNSDTLAVEFILSNYRISIANLGREWGDLPREYHKIMYLYFPPADA